MKKFTPAIRKKDANPEFDHLNEISKRKLQKKQMIRKGFFRVLFFILIAAFVIYAYSTLFLINTTGLVVGDRVYYSAPISGNIAKLYVKEFEEISPNELLYTIDNPEISSQIESVEQEIKSLEEILNSQNKSNESGVVDLDIAELDYQKANLDQETELLLNLLEQQKSKSAITQEAADRAKYLFEADAGTKRMWENRKLQALDAAIEVKMTESKINNKKANLLFLNQKMNFYTLPYNVNLDNSAIPPHLSSIYVTIRQRMGDLELLKKQKNLGNVTAKHKGQVVRIFKNEDSFVQPGDDIIKAVRNDKTYIRVYLPPKYLKYVGIGQEVTIFSEDIIWTGKVTEVSNELVPIAESFRKIGNISKHYAEIRVEVKDPHDAPRIFFKQGLQVDVRFKK